MTYMHQYLICPFIQKHSLASVSKVTGNVEPGLLAQLHCDNALVPTPDDTANTNGSLERTTTGGAVKLLALVGGGVLEPASVLHGDSVALFRGWAVALLNDGLGDTHCACG